MNIRRILRKCWKGVMMAVFGLSFLKDLILIAVVAGMMAFGISGLIAVPVAVCASLVLNLIGYTIAT